MINYFTNEQLDFFIKVKNGVLSELAILNIIEKLTGNKLGELQALSEDLFIYVEIEKEHYNNEDIDRAIKLLQESGKPVPYRIVEDTKILDVSSLLHPNGFSWYNKLDAIFKDLILKASVEIDYESKKVLLTENPHPSIFVDPYAYKLFISWHVIYCENKDRHTSSYSFIIRKMLEEDLILDIKLGKLIEFLNIKFDIPIGRFKTMHEIDVFEKNLVYERIKENIHR